MARSTCPWWRTAAPVRARRSRRDRPTTQMTVARARTATPISWRIDTCSGMPPSRHHGPGLWPRTVTYLADALKGRVVGRSGRDRLLGVDLRRYRGVGDPRAGP